MRRKKIITTNEDRIVGHKISDEDRLRQAIERKEYRKAELIVIEMGLISDICTNYPNIRQETLEEIVKMPFLSREDFRLRFMEMHTKSVRLFNAPGNYQPYANIPTLDTAYKKLVGDKFAEFKKHKSVAKPSYDWVEKAGKKVAGADVTMYSDLYGNWGPHKAPTADDIQSMLDAIGGSVDTGSTTSNKPKSWAQVAAPNFPIVSPTGPKIWPAGIDEATKKACEALPVNELKIQPSPANTPKHSHAIQATEFEAYKNEHVVRLSPVMAIDDELHYIDWDKYGEVVIARRHYRCNQFDFYYKASIAGDWSIDCRILVGEKGIVYRHNDHIVEIAPRAAEAVKKEEQEGVICIN